MMVLFFAGLMARCYCLQVAGNFPHQQNTVSRSLTVKQTPRRGMILDRCGRRLAVSNRIAVAFADPELVGDLKDTANYAADVLNIPAHELCMKIDFSNARRYVKLQEDISEQQAMMLSKTPLNGIGIHKSWQRNWPAGKLACHITGFTGADNKGLGGLELKYDSLLSGSEGSSVFIADSRRRPIRLERANCDVDNGSSLLITIDTTIQEYVRQALSQRCLEYQAESGVAVVMDPTDGAVLAMVSYPDFDPANPGDCSPDALRNRALTDVYEPGSIFKPIVTAAALDVGVIGFNDVIYCEHGNYSGKGFGRIGEYGNHEYGNLKIRDILVNSSNIGMAKIGQKMGKTRLYKAVRMFGFGSRTGIDLPGEDPGLVWPSNRWTGYSVTRIPFGQEITVTAIQIARAYCILANGGYAVKPHLVRAVIDSDGRHIDVRPSTESVGRIIDTEIANWIVRKALTEVVNEGTGKKAAIEGTQVFGKTGTANIAKPNGGGYDEKNYIASFVGGAPAENPRLIVLVSIRKPNRALGKGYTGGTVSGPVVREILKKSLTYLENYRVARAM